jgi:sulfonate transport system permease protein
MNGARATIQRWGGWAVPILLLIVWEAAARAGRLPDTFLPSPSSVFLTALRLLKTGELEQNIWISSYRALAGFVLGGAVGLTLGFANGLSRWSETLTDTTLQMLRNVPHLAMIPLVILWFGIDETAKLFLVAIGVFFPIYINTLHGIRSVDPHLIEMGRVYGMTSQRLFSTIVLPGALPSIFVGVRYSLGIMWLTLIVAETVSASSGLGYMAMQAREFLLIDVVVLSIVIYALLGKLADVIARALERYWLQWNPAYRQ